MLQSLKNRNWWWLPLSIALGFSPVMIPQTILNTLYTIIGIFFGIGFSLIISSVYREVGSSQDRIELRKNVKNIREIFFFYFVASSIFYFITSVLSRQNIVYCLDKYWKGWKDYDIVTYLISNFHITFVSFVVFIIVIAIFLRNYSSLQKLNEDVDEELAK